MKGGEIDPQLISGILEAARWAPSPYNVQPWHFVVVREGNNQLWDTIEAAGAAYALGKGTEVGKKADILILETSDYWDLAYRFSGNLVVRVFKGGQSIWLKEADRVANRSPRAHRLFLRLLDVPRRGDKSC